MKEAIWSRVGPASGILFFVLLMGGASIHGYPDIRPSDSQLSAWLANLNLDQFRAGVYIECLGIALFIPFVAWLYGRLRQGRKDASWPAVTMVAAGAAWVAFTLAAMSGWAGLAEQARKGLDVRTAQTVAAINQASYDLTGIVLGLAVLAAGVAIVRGGAMAQWLGWAAIVTGLIDVAMRPFGIDALPIGFLVYLWIFGVAIYCTFRPARKEVAGTAKHAVTSSVPVTS